MVTLIVRADQAQTCGWVYARPQNSKDFHTTRHLSCSLSALAPWQRNSRQSSSMGKLILVCNCMSVSIPFTPSGSV